MSGGGTIPLPTTNGGKVERVLIRKLHASGTWTKASTQIRVNPKPFAEGAFRQAYMTDFLWEGKWQQFVCKFAKDKNTPRSLYFKDIEAQIFAQVWAKKYNKEDPPKAVRFASCFVLELVDRPGRPVCGAEVYINGEFKKHNNNVGAVCVGDGNDPKLIMDRKTAQAFSHFTFDASQGQLLICDIQGVGGVYTDPQIHTLSGQGFGSGNLGQTGIRAFLLRHKCNEVCRSVGLAPIHAKQLGSGKVVDRKHATFNFTTLLADAKQGCTAHNNNILTINSIPTKRSNSDMTGQYSHVNVRNSKQNSQPAPSRPTLPFTTSPPQTDLPSEPNSPTPISPTASPPKSVMDEADEKLMASILNGLSM